MVFDFPETLLGSSQSLKHQIKQQKKHQPTNAMSDLK
jgi:hypothetical protein